MAHKAFLRLNMARRYCGMGSGVCAHCGVEFKVRSQPRRFCSAKCRAAAWQAARKGKEDRLRGLVKTLAKEAGLTPEDFA
jgi:hypothetical protein